MRIHWHWPFARPEELGWAEATVRPGDSLVVSVVDRAAAPAESADGPVVVVRDLPDVRRDLRVGPRWAWSRARTYLGRAEVRRRHWRDDGPIDLTHIHYLNRFMDAFTLGRNRPPVVVLSVHDLRPHVRRGPAWVDRRLLQRVYRHVDAFI
ncbi:MAG: hypothetical protein ACR2OH_05745, partial [Microthrixaceae bacterium]